MCYHCRVVGTTLVHSQDDVSVGCAMLLRSGLGRQAQRYYHLQGGPQTNRRGYKTPRTARWSVDDASPKQQQNDCSIHTLELVM